MMYSKTILAFLLAGAILAVFAEKDELTLEPIIVKSDRHSTDSSQRHTNSSEEYVQLIKNGAYRYEPGTAICDGGKCDTCPKGVPLGWNEDLSTCEFYDIAWDKHEEGGWLALCKHVGYFDPIVYTIGGVRYPIWDAYNGCCAIWHKRACPPKYVAHPEELWGTMAQYLLVNKHRSLFSKE